jgi:predicted transcriptional regulator
MSTLAEIQDAISKLPKEEKNALSLWLNSQTGTDLTPADEERLLRSLDEAMRDIDAGKGVPLDEVRKRVTSWAAK